MSPLQPALLCATLFGFSTTAHADPRAQCHQLLEEALANAPPPPACNPADPACASLQPPANNIRAVMNRNRKKSAQDQLSASCKPIVAHRCDAFATLMKQGHTEVDAWICAMSGCSKDPNTIGVGFIACVCQGEPQISDCAPPAKPLLSPLVVPEPPGHSSSTNPKL